MVYDNQSVDSSKNNCIEIPEVDVENTNLIEEYDNFITEISRVIEFNCREQFKLDTLPNDVITCHVTN